MLLFIGRTPTLSCARATLKQNISMSDRYLSAPNIFFETAIRYISFFVPTVGSQERERERERDRERQRDRDRDRERNGL